MSLIMRFMEKVSRTTSLVFLALAMLLTASALAANNTGAEPNCAQLPDGMVVEGPY